MITRGLACLVLAALTSACGSVASPAPKTIEFGTFHLQAVVPSGWDFVDHGSQKRFRNGELEIVLEKLGGSGDPADRGLAAIDFNPNRYEVKSRHSSTIDGREVIDIETWSVLDHTWPQRVSVIVADDVFALYTTRAATGELLKAFETVRASLHFPSTKRR